MSDLNLFSCSFCGTAQKDAKKLIAGPQVYICDECVELCHEILKEDKEPKLPYDIED